MERSARELADSIANFAHTMSEVALIALVIAITVGFGLMLFAAIMGKR